MSAINLTQWANGNPGAMSFLMELTSDSDKERTVIIMKALEQCPSIRGTNLYVLWSDLCNKDLNTVFNTCMLVPNKVLEDACSRQDYSGRQLIKEYL